MEVWTHPEGEAFFGNLQKCGSVWTCPICALRITEHRRIELGAAIAAAEFLGYSVVLVSWTVPHHVRDQPKPLLEKLLKARERMKNRMPWRRWCESISYVGQVRALEITQGLNGPHPHIHDLIFYRAASQPRADDLLPMWQAACKSVGLARPNKHGVDVSGGHAAAEYVSKGWALEHEMTKSHIKRGHRTESRSLFDLLRAAGDGEEEAGKLFQENTSAMKGKAQLLWSRGLRKILKLESEKSDAVLANYQKESESTKLGTVAQGEWSLIVARGLQAEVLEAATLGGWSAVSVLLGGLVAAARSGQACRLCRIRMRRPTALAP